VFNLFANLLVETMPISELKCYIIAGPNGAGKTTFAENFLPEEAGCLNFLNADLIARGIAPFKPESVALEAGKILRNIISHWSTLGLFLIIQEKIPKFWRKKYE